MDETQRLSDLTGNIYDAALDPALWISVLESAAKFVGGPAASLYSKDVADKSANVAYQFGLDPRYVQLYLEKYIKYEPTSTGYFFAQLEEPTSTSDVMPYDEFVETRFYQEWGKPQGLVDTAHALLEKSATSAAAFVVFRHERDGLVDDEARRRMRLIVPHIRRAVLIGKVLELKKAEATSLADAFDGFSAGIFLVDATGRIVHANAAGQARLDQTDLLRSVGGRLVIGDPHTDRVLGDAFVAAGSGDSALGRRGIAVPLRTRDGDRYVGHVLPLTSGARRRAGANYAAVAALFVRRAGLSAPPVPEVIAKAYRLTPTELRVLLAIVDIPSIREIAEALGIAETTVKTHLGRLYEKTGARRQTDLVKLVAGYAAPVAG